MSTLGVGTDLVELGRMSGLLGEHPQRFLERCFRPGDLARSAPTGSDASEFLAGSWAAKEAFLKALGTQLRHIPYRDIELVSNSGVGLRLNLYGVAKNAARQAGVGTMNVSISRTSVAALALVVLED